MFERRVRTKVSVIAVVLMAAALFFTSSLSAADHYVKYYKDIPQVLWCRGCAPTAASMAFGFWDNYVVGVPVHTGYGRLVDYWRNVSENADGSGHTRNVPNIQLELLSAFHTDSAGVTFLANITPGILNVANTRHSYGFTSTAYAGSRGNNFCWDIIKAEVAHGHPFIWSVGYSAVGHSLCAWGFTDKKYVITYNTWNFGREDWYYRKYNNTTLTTWWWVNTVTPGGGQSSNMLITYPLAYRVYPVGSRATIYWYTFGQLINRVSIYYSRDGGSHWTRIISGRYNKPYRWNSYKWTIPNKLAPRCRVKVYGYRGTTYVAGDGLKLDFRIASH